MRTSCGILALAHFLVSLEVSGASTLRRSISPRSQDVDAKPEVVVELISVHAIVPVVGETVSTNKTRDLTEPHVSTPQKKRLRRDGTGFTVVRRGTAAHDNPNTTQHDHPALRTRGAANDAQSSSAASTLLKRAKTNNGINLTTALTKRDLPAPVAALLQAEKAAKNVNETALLKRDLPAPLAALLQAKAGKNSSAALTKRYLPILKRGKTINATNPATSLTKRDFPAPLAALLGTNKNASTALNKRDMLKRGKTNNATATPLTKRDFPAPLAALLGANKNSSAALTKRDFPAPLAALLGTNKNASAALTKRDLPMLKRGKTNNATATPSTKRDLPAPLAALLANNKNSTSNN